MWVCLKPGHQKIECFLLLYCPINMAPYWGLDSPIPGQLPSRWPLRLLCVNSAADVVSRLHFQLVGYNGLLGIPFLTQLGCEFPKLGVF
jgi:hypothetical protein